MDVQCPNCKTEYSVTSIPSSGYSIRCTACNFKFRIQQRITVTAEPTAVGMPAAPDSGAFSEGKWAVRRQDGSVMYFKELTTLQRWIVEHRVDEADLISKGGQAWKRLSEMVELASFFQVVKSLPQHVQPRAPLMSATLPPVESRRSAAGSGAADAAAEPTAAIGAYQEGPTQLTNKPWLDQAASQGQATQTKPMGYGYDDEKPTMVMESPFALDEFDDEFTVPRRKGRSTTYVLLGMFGTLIVVVVVALAFFQPQLAVWFPEWFGREGGTRRQVSDNKPLDASDATQPRKAILAATDATTPRGPDADATTQRTVKVTRPAPPVGPVTPLFKKPTTVPQPVVVHKQPSLVPPTPDNDEEKRLKEQRLKEQRLKEKRLKEKRLKEKRLKEKRLKEKRLKEKRRPRDNRLKEKTNLKGYALLIDKGKKALKSNPTAALDYFFKASQRSPGNVTPLLLLASTYRRLGNVGGAIAYYRRALALSPSSASALYGIGSCYFASGQSSLGVKFYKRFLAVRPSGRQSDNVREKLKKLGVL